MKFLITGANGQLAREFIKHFSKNNVDFLALTKSEFDISNVNQTFEVIDSYKPSVIINCAAYNLVDRAESFPHEALRVNTHGISNLIFASMKYGSFLIHYSTDYVFDGTKEGLYVEEDKENPLNKYGLSKYLGEEAVKNTLDKYLIFRTSWVYGEGVQNFLYKLENWAKTNDYLKIACDEFSVPTSTNTLVNITLKALDKGLIGLYHLTNSGYASRYEWAKAYFELKGIKKFIYPAYQKDFNLPAKRPRWSAMSNEKLSKTLDIDIPNWEEEMKKLYL